MDCAVLTRLNARPLPLLANHTGDGAVLHPAAAIAGGLPTTGVDP